MTQQPWTAADMPSLKGRTVIVTGANSGVGLATANALAVAGAHVVLAVRDAQRGEEAAQSMTGSTEVRRLDLADLSSVRAFAEDWTGEVNILINNAGVAGGRGTRTKDGFDMQFGTNHLGHFALTNLLLPHITERVVTLSSGAHKAGDIHFDDIGLQKRKYSLPESYGQSKLANLLFAQELQHRLEQAGSPVLSMAAHPGYSSTNLGIKGRSKLIVSAVSLAGRLFAQTSAQGALPTLFAATADIPAGSYVGPDGRWELQGHPTLVGRTDRAADPALAKRLWDLSEELTGVCFGLDVG